MGGVILGSSLTTLEAIGMQRVWEHELVLTRRVIAGLSSIPNVTVLADNDVDQTLRAGVISFTAEDLHHAKVSAALSDYFNIATRDGCFCAHPYIKSLRDLPDMVHGAEAIWKNKSSIILAERATVGVYTNRHDVERLIAGVTWVVSNQDRINAEYTVDDHGQAYRLDGWGVDPAVYDVQPLIVGGVLHYTAPPKMEETTIDPASFGPLPFVRREPTHANDAARVLFREIFGRRIEDVRKIMSERIDPLIIAAIEQGHSARAAELAWLKAWIYWQAFEAIMDDPSVDQHVGQASFLIDLVVRYMGGLRSFIKVPESSNRTHPLFSRQQEIIDLDEEWNQVRSKIYRIASQYHGLQERLGTIHAAVDGAAPSPDDVHRSYHEIGQAFLKMAEQLGKEMGFKMLGHRMIHLAESSLTTIIGENPEEPDGGFEGVKAEAYQTYQQLKDLHQWYHDQSDGNAIFLAEQLERLQEGAEQLAGSIAQVGLEDDESLGMPQRVTAEEAIVFQAPLLQAEVTLHQALAQRDELMQAWREREFEQVILIGINVAWNFRSIANHSFVRKINDAESAAMIIALTALRMAELAIVTLERKGKTPVSAEFKDFLRKVIVEWRVRKRRLDAIPVPRVEARERAPVMSAHVGTTPPPVAVTDSSSASTTLPSSAEPEPSGGCIAHTTGIDDGQFRGIRIVGGDALAPSAVVYTGGTAAPDLALQADGQSPNAILDTAWKIANRNNLEPLVDLLSHQAQAENMLLGFKPERAQHYVTRALSAINVDAGDYFSEIRELETQNQERFLTLAFMAYALQKLDFPVEDLGHILRAELSPGSERRRWGRSRRTLAMRRVRSRVYSRARLRARARISRAVRFVR